MRSLDLRSMRFSNGVLFHSISRSYQTRPSHVVYRFWLISSLVPEIYKSTRLTIICYISMALYTPFQYGLTKDIIITFLTINKGHIN